MCSSYGLAPDAEVGFVPQTHAALRELAVWGAEQEGRAAITGRVRRNLNPVVVSSALFPAADAAAAGADPEAAAGARSLVFGWWWLWLDGRGPAQFSAFNSRDDKLLGTWRPMFQQRALLPASWFVEKKGRFALPGGEGFAIAAITRTVMLPEGPLLTYSMVTREAVGAVAEVWHRMPLLVPGDMHEEWLSPERPGDDSLRAAALAASVVPSRELVRVDG